MKFIRSVVFTFIMLLSATAFSGPVNINQADASTLAAELHGVGASKAEAIVSYRKKHGPFKRAEDLTKVKGIGMKTFSKNRNNILLK